MWRGGAGAEAVSDKQIQAVRRGLVRTKKKEERSEIIGAQRGRGGADSSGALSTTTDTAGIVGVTRSNDRRRRNRPMASIGAPTAAGVVTGQS